MNRFWNSRSGEPLGAATNTDLLVDAVKPGEDATRNQLKGLFSRPLSGLGLGPVASRDWIPVAASLHLCIAVAKTQQRLFRIHKLLRGHPSQTRSG